MTVGLLAQQLGHDCSSDPQVAGSIPNGPREKNSITIYQAIRNQMMKSGVSISFFALFMILFH
jgi:hypothetical protein